jgi:hypothetical protein
MFVDKIVKKILVGWWLAPPLFLGFLFSRRRHGDVVIPAKLVPAKAGSRNPNG